MSQPRKNYTISLADPDWKALEAAAEKQGITPSGFVRLATLEKLHKPA